MVSTNVAILCKILLFFKQNTHPLGQKTLSFFGFGQFFTPFHTYTGTFLYGIHISDISGPAGGTHIIRFEPSPHELLSGSETHPELHCCYIDNPLYSITYAVN